MLISRIPKKNICCSKKRRRLSWAESLEVHQWFTHQKTLQFLGFFLGDLLAPEKNIWNTDLRSCNFYVSKICVSMGKSNNNVKCCICNSQLLKWRSPTTSAPQKNGHQHSWKPKTEYHDLKFTWCLAILRVCDLFGTVKTWPVTRNQRLRIVSSNERGMKWWLCTWYYGLMEEILHQMIGSLSHCCTRFYTSQVVGNGSSEPSTVGTWIFSVSMA